MLCKSVEDIRQGFLSFNSLLPQCLCLHPPSISGGGPSFAPSPDGLCWFLSFARMMFYWAFCISWTLKSFSSLRPLSSAPWTFVSSGMVPCLLLDKCLPMDFTHVLHFLRLLHSKCQVPGFYCHWLPSSTFRVHCYLLMAKHLRLCGLSPTTGIKTARTVEPVFHCRN